MSGVVNIGKGRIPLGNGFIQKSRIDFLNPSLSSGPDLDDGDVDTSVGRQAQVREDVGDRGDGFDLWAKGTGSPEGNGEGFGLIPTFRESPPFGVVPLRRTPVDGCPDSEEVVKGDGQAPVGAADEVVERIGTLRNGSLCDLLGPLLPFALVLFSLFEKVDNPGDHGHGLLRHVKQSLSSLGRTAATGNA